MESSTTQEIAKPNGTIWLAVDGIRPFFKPPPPLPCAMAGNARDARMG
jgi:hypothetical protein